MTLRNEGADPDRLVAARAAFARAVELHTHSVDAQGVMRMRQVSAIDVDPGAEVSLQPGGLHLMLLGLEPRLVAETLVLLTLVFERAGDIEIELEIGSMRSRPGHDHRHTH
jgi:copper(I)-binding protein